MAHYRYYGSICLEGTEENDENSNNSRYPGRDSNRGSPEYNSRALFLEKKNCSVHNSYIMNSRSQNLL
jgi:hypothetical protein